MYPPRCGSWIFQVDRSVQRFETLNPFDELAASGIPKREFLVSCLKKERSMSPSQPNLIHSWLVRGLTFISREAGLGSWTGKCPMSPTNPGAELGVWAMPPCHPNGATPSCVPAAEWLEEWHWEFPQPCHAGIEFYIAEEDLNKTTAARGLRFSAPASLSSPHHHSNPDRPQRALSRLRIKIPDGF